MGGPAAPVSGAALRLPSHGGSTLAATQAAFRSWCLGYSGSDGGDLGSPRRPSTWVCGIEPGAARVVDADALAGQIGNADVSRPAPGYEHWRCNLVHSFTRRIVKLLAALAGARVADYREFAERQQPFTRGARGFCRLNLYPLAFADTRPGRWNPALAQATGFACKADYLAWCDAHRLPQLRAWARACRPRLVIALGKSYGARFHAAFMDPATPLAHESIAGKQLCWGRNEGGTVLAILPFLTSASGLQSDAAIQAFGARLRGILAQLDSARGPDRMT